MEEGGAVSPPPKLKLAPQNYFPGAGAVQRHSPLLLVQKCISSLTGAFLVYVRPHVEYNSPH